MTWMLVFKKAASKDDAGVAQNAPDEVAESFVKGPASAHLKHERVATEHVNLGTTKLGAYLLCHLQQTCNQR